jgi:NitT/TauT family transport system ATP-binding protein
VTAEPPTYRIDGLGVRFLAAGGARQVLRDVTFEVAAGEIVAIVGRSGSGKTTLLRTMAGLLPVSDGVVSARGSAITGVPDGVAMVFQDYGNALLPWRTVARNVALGIEHCVAKGERQRRVAQALHMVGLAGREADYPGQLSGGMAQRVQLARALAMRADVLLMDEPFGALDAMTKAILQDVLLDLHRQTGATVVFVTHDLEEAIYLSDRVLVLAGDPGSVALRLPTRLARPRDQLSSREHPDFLAARHRLGNSLRAADVHR